jgi:uncharacterized radical SAM superfamily Fe-S cluster-containing enzyme
VEIKRQLDATDVFIADLIACSTFFRHYYAHHQELEIIIQMVAACGIVCPVCGPQTGHTTLSSTPYRQLENQSTKYHRQQPSV